VSKDEKTAMLAEHLAKFRAWSYAQLAERVERDRCEQECLDQIEATATDGTKVQMEFNVCWDDKSGSDVRVYGDLSASPQKPLLGFIPIYTPDVMDSFIMRPDGTFVDEPDAKAA